SSAFAVTPPPDTTNPTVSSVTVNPTSVAAGSNLSVSWSASDNVGVDHVGLYLWTGGASGSAVDTSAYGGGSDGRLSTAALTLSNNSSPYSWAVPATLPARSDYAIKAAAWDAAGNHAGNFSSAFA